MNSLDYDENAEIETSKTWWFFVCLYLIIDYGRPQDTLKIIGYIRPVIIITFFLIFYLLRNFRLIHFKTPQLALILCFLLLLAAFVPFAENNFFAYKTFTAMFWIMPFTISCMVIDSLKRFKTILLIAIISFAYQALFGIRHGGRGTGSIFMDENDFALYINMWLPFSYLFFLMAKKKITKIFYLFSILFGLAGVIISFSRGGFLGLLAMFTVIWIFSPRKVLTTAIVIVGAITIFFVANLTSHGNVKHQKSGSYWNEMSTSTNGQAGTGKERVESWKAGWNMFLHNPLGVGGDNFRVRFQDYQSTYFHRQMWGRAAHSLWFTLIPELGIEGIFIYLLLLFVNIRDILRLRKYANFLEEDEAKFFRNLSVAFLASLAGFFTSATFLSVLYYPHYWYMTGLIVASRRVIENRIIIISQEDGVLNVS